MPDEINRRQFLTRTSAAATALYSTAGLARAAARSPNETLHVACIGAGGKGESDITSTAEAGGRIVAICDVDDRRAADSYKRFPDAKRFHDYREMLDRLHKSIDAVIVSTPDHMHAAQTLAAMRLGKHVYTQKPLTHNIREARLLAETARERKVVSQMGNQGTANERHRQAVEILRSGAIGPVREVHVWTNRPVWPQGATALVEHAAVRSAIHGEVQRKPIPSHLKWDLWLGCVPARPYDSIYHPFNWRGWTVFGTGALGDMGCHVMNIAYMALRLGAPEWVEAETAPDMNEETYPSWSVIRYQFPARGEPPGLSRRGARAEATLTSQDRTGSSPVARPGDLPPVLLTWYDGGPNRPEWVTRRLQEISGTKDPAETGSAFVGDKGVFYAPHEARTKPTLLPSEQFKDFKTPEPTLPRVKGHYDEWVQACLGSKPEMCMSGFHHAGPFTETVLLGNVAMLAGKRIEWDAAAMKVTNVPEANRYIGREYRKGWDI